MLVSVTDLFSGGRRVGRLVAGCSCDAQCARMLDAGDVILRAGHADLTLTRAQVVELVPLARFWHGLCHDLQPEWTYDREQQDLDPDVIGGLVRVHAAPRLHGGLLEWAGISTASGRLRAVVLRLASGLDALVTLERVYVGPPADERRLRRFAILDDTSGWHWLDGESFDLLAEVASLLAAASP